MADIGGVVKAVGPSVSDFQPGDRVLAFASASSAGSLDGGAFQNYTIAKVLTVAKLPDDVDFKRGAVIPMGVVTSSVALFDSLGIPLPNSASASGQGSALLVWGGSSSVGSNAVQLGHRLGFTVFATASLAHHEYLKSLGANDVFDYHSPSVVDDVVSAAKKAGKPVAYAVDAVSLPASLQPSVEVLEKSGGKGSKLAIVLGWPDAVPKPDGVEVLSVAGRRIFEEKRIANWVFRDFLTAALGDGSFKPSPEVQLVNGGLEGLQTGLNTLKKGVSGKKIVVELE